MPKGKRHGNLNAKASQVYEDIRQEHPGYSKTKAAKIANSVSSKLKRAKSKAKAAVKRRGKGKK